MDRITFEQEKGITNLEIFRNSREEVINFFRDYAQMMLDSDYNEEQNEQNETYKAEQDLKY